MNRTLSQEHGKGPWVGEKRGLTGDKRLKGQKDGRTDGQREKQTGREKGRQARRKARTEG